ncbi:unnamed protein product [Prorocentrum cordatum]|uniref:Uncharacterized protein n=1 Tax=Prorocentrum cordatum TaxID=2364126 RepID=A0ABN9VGB2_9DINO|nr:unnamed protein product [Polarella glacialis]
MQGSPRWTQAATIYGRSPVPGGIAWSLGNLVAVVTEEAVHVVSAEAAIERTHEAVVVARIGLPDAPPVSGAGRVGRELKRGLAQRPGSSGPRSSRALEARFGLTSWDSHDRAESFEEAVERGRRRAFTGVAWSPMGCGPRGSALLATVDSSGLVGVHVVLPAGGDAARGEAPLVCAIAAPQPGLAPASRGPPSAAGEADAAQDPPAACAARSRKASAQAPRTRRPPPPRSGAHDRSRTRHRADRPASGRSAQQRPRGEGLQAPYAPARVAFCPSPLPGERVARPQSALLCAARASLVELWRVGVEPWECTCLATHQLDLCGGPSRHAPVITALAVAPARGARLALLLGTSSGAVQALPARVQASLPGSAVGLDAEEPGCVLSQAVELQGPGGAAVAVVAEAAEFDGAGRPNCGAETARGAWLVAMAQGTEVSAVLSRGGLLEVAHGRSCSGVGQRFRNRACAHGLPVISLLIDASGTMAGAKAGASFSEVARVLSLDFSGRAALWRLCAAADGELGAMECEIRTMLPLQPQNWLTAVEVAAMHVDFRVSRPLATETIRAGSVQSTCMVFSPSRSMVASVVTRRMEKTTQQKPTCHLFLAPTGTASQMFLSLMWSACTSLQRARDSNALGFHMWDVAAAWLSLRQGVAFEIERSRRPAQANRTDHGADGPEGAGGTTVARLLAWLWERAESAGLVTAVAGEPPFLKGPLQESLLERLEAEVRRCVREGRQIEHCQLRNALLELGSRMPAAQAEPRGAPPGGSREALRQDYWACRVREGWPPVKIAHWARRPARSLPTAAAGPASAFGQWRSLRRAACAERPRRRTRRSRARPAGATRCPSASGPWPRCSPSRTPGAASAAG